jgi:hypothetical protein
MQWRIEAPVKNPAISDLPSAFGFGTKPFSQLIAES